MKHSYYSSLFSMVSQIAQAIPGANGLNNNNINPLFDRVGIKFDIKSAGKLYPGNIEIKKTQKLRQKGVASHL